ncbi:hypothetical protein K438DRAFT_996802 [Mycena galopus ATCC 62051]|nr:hypothetical protein K438DRAFT_996802 [Mycena galopus ATCC 62051]
MDSTHVFHSTVNIRDSVPHRAPLPLASELFSALKGMATLTKVTLHLGLFRRFHWFQTFFVLQVRLARLDGVFSPVDLLFTSLSRLLISISGCGGAHRATEIDRVAEMRNVAAFLHILADRLVNLCISGDLLSFEFASLRWPNFRKFDSVELAPTPFIHVPELLAHIPALRAIRSKQVGRDGPANNTGTSGRPPNRVHRG